MDKFVESYHIARNQLHTIYCTINRLNISIADSRTELSQITPAYKDFPVLVDRCFELENIINKSIIKLKILHRRKSELETKRSEMGQILESDYILITNYKYHRTDRMYIKRDTYNDYIKQLHNKILSDEELREYIHALTCIKHNECTYTDVFEYLLRDDALKLLDVYRARVKKYTPLSWWKKLWHKKL